MKKHIMIFIAAACIMLFAGCSQAEEDHSELDSLIEQLQTTHLNTGSPEEGAETEEPVPYKSLTGTVTSFSESEITVRADGKEQKFTVNETTQILGGDRSTAKTVTVTYCEPEKKSKSTAANVITILESAEADTENIVTEPTPQAVSETTEDTSAHTEESAADTESESEPASQPETEANTVTETDAEETTTETEDTATETEPKETPTETEDIAAETEADTQSETETEAQEDVPAETQF